MSSRVIAVVSANSRCGARPQRSAILATSPGANPPSLRRPVGSIAIMKPLAVATCTFHAGATAPSASRIARLGIADRHFGFALLGFLLSVRLGSRRLLLHQLR